MQFDIKNVKASPGTTLSGVLITCGLFYWQMTEGTFESWAFVAPAMIFSSSLIVIKSPFRKKVCTGHTPAAPLATPENKEQV